MNRWIARMALFALTALPAAQAQLAASMQLNKREYLAGEPVIATISVTNHAGRELTFRGDPRNPWIEFVIDGRNRPVQLIGQPVFGVMQLPAGQTVARQVDLSSIYSVSEPGSYSVNAVIRMPDNPAASQPTNRTHFNVSPGRTYWSQRVGIPGRGNQIREYRVVHFTSGDSSQLFSQVYDEQTGQRVRTALLGDVLMLRRPSVTVDGKQRMHVLFMANPTTWLHFEVDTDGRIVDRAIHQRPPHGDPRLVSFADGTVRVGNSIPVDIEARRAARQNTRRLSDRPAVVFPE